MSSYRQWIAAQAHALRSAVPASIANHDHHLADQVRGIANPEDEKAWALCSDLVRSRWLKVAREASMARLL